MIKVITILILVTPQIVMASGNDHVEDSHGHENHSHNHEESRRDEHEDEKKHEHGQIDGHEEAKSVIAPKLASSLGVVVSSVEGVELNQTVSAYGNIVNGSEQLSHVRARFPGQISNVYAHIGDTVKRGQTLMKIESNDSLQQYEIVAPISGKVIQRHANRGEFAQEQVLFSIANFQHLWVEFRIYPSQIDKVKAGQLVNFEVGSKTLNGKIKHLIPVENKPYQLARLEFDNTQVGTSPGILVEGKISVSSFRVPIAVKKDGIQKIEGKNGVFVQTGSEYRFTPLDLGREDGIYVEVLNGISEGEKYVSENSYLLKADVEKSEAEHEH